MGCAVNGAPIWAAKPPAHLPRWLLMKVLAYRLQSDAFGDLDKSIRRILRSGKEDGVGAPFDRRAPQTREGLGLKAGALLVREWKGKLERVMILEEGFAWNGQTFGSLSQIAKAMTGTNWNGHRFFGLRQGKTARGRRGRGSPKEQKGPARCRANGASAGGRVAMKDQTTKTQSPLRDLYARLDRSGARTGLQFPRRPAGGVRGLHQEPGA